MADYSNYWSQLGGDPTPTTPAPPILSDTVAGDVDSSASELDALLDEAITDTGTGLRSVVDGIDPVKKASSLVEGAGDIPIAGSMTSNDVVEAYNMPEESEWDETLRKITGINLGGGSKTGIKNKFFNKLGALKDLILGQLLTCLEKLMLKLSSKVPIINLLLNFEAIIGQFAGKYRRAVDDFIDKTLTNIIYRKLQLQQAAEFNKKINGLVRSICEEASEKNNRDWQNDFSVAKYVAEASASELSKALEENVQDQAAGYAARDPESYVNSDGSLKTTSERLKETIESLKKVKKDNLTIEEGVALQGLIAEIAMLKSRDIDESNLAAITC